MTAATNGSVNISQFVTADGVDAYSAALPGFHLDLVRTGVGFGPNITWSVSFDDVALCAGAIGFPMLSQTNVTDGRVAAALVTAAPPGSRWCEIDLQPGTVLLYGPGSDHTGISPAGLEFAFVTVDIDTLGRAAHQLELRQGRIAAGSIWSVAPTADVRSLAAALRTVQRQPISESVAAAVRRATVDALATVLATESSVREPARHRTLNNRRLVHRCIEYYEASEGSPSMSELSDAVFVSERRLRQAFTSTLGVAPHKYFRYRGINHAHSRLVSGHEEPLTVTRVAADLEFWHLGRFSADYARIYGEAPSSTLAPATR